VPLREVYITGLNSDPNPTSGLGVARSLKTAYPNLKLVGVDYAVRSTGLHDTIFDDIIIMNTWNEIDLNTYANQIRKWLSPPGCYWISNLDVEIWWLAFSLPDMEKILIPPISALKETRKPHVKAATELPFKIPPFIMASEPDDDIFEFFIRHGRNVWVKGPYYEARRVTNWSQLKAEIRSLRRTWGEGVYIQANINGREELIAYAAYEGELLDAVHVVKLLTTPEGKTWAGRVYSPPREIIRPLKHTIKKLKWTGGGELEFIRTAKGELYLIEWNPRFPAWIYGATIAGHNLPAKLIEAASGEAGLKIPVISTDFIRVVYEIPTKINLDEPVVSKLSMEQIHISKHPSGMPLLARTLYKFTPLHDLLTRYRYMDDKKHKQMRCVKTMHLRTLKRYANSCEKTPTFIFLEKILKNRLMKTKHILNNISEELGVDISAAYSIKTNPDERVLKMALSNGFLAEAISWLEVEKALKCGFKYNQIILNGPGKMWPRGQFVNKIFALFADSLTELRHILNLTASADITEVLGIRIRAPFVNSRFGVNIGMYDEFIALTKLIRLIPMHVRIGLHFHVPSIIVGVHVWTDVYKTIVKLARVLERACGREINIIDIGGGWSPKAWDELFLPKLLPKLVKYAQCNLNNLEAFLLEPGRALVEPCFILLTRILEVRKRTGNAPEVVVDASIAEMPQALYKPHRILYYDTTTSKLIPLRKGDGIILGRLCMEEDILAMDVDFPKSIKENDMLIFLDVGAYDMSMSYTFGRGSICTI